MKAFDKLNFVTAGIPIKCGSRGYDCAFEVLREFQLDGIELEFVHGVRISEASQNSVRRGISKGYAITAHGPYYINLNAREADKIEASKARIIETAMMLDKLGGYSITYHAAYNLGQDPKFVFEQVKKGTKEIIIELEKSRTDVWIRPETTGKKTQWGDLEEIIKLSKEFECVLPCVDFAHLHARHNGRYNTYDEYCKILETIATELGRRAIDNFHGHVAGIAYTDKGERHHLILKESDVDYKNLLKALKSFEVKGVLVCESPNIEEDCKLLKDYWSKL